jgi:O-antigen/teichoic acid export membrane protein
MGLDSILLGWNIRLKEFKRGAFAKIFSTIASKAAAILFALIYKPFPLGIIISNVLIYPIEGSAKLSRAIGENVHRIFTYTSWSDLKSTLKVYKSYAIFLTPGVIVINASNLMPIYFISIAFDEVSVGHYALASGLVGMPMALLINSSITVFLQKAAETLHRSKEELKSIVLLLYKRLFIVSFLPLVLLAFSCKYGFRLIFGDEWEQAGVYASFLCIPATLHIIQGPLSVLYRLMNFERYNFVINSLFFGIKFIGLWIGFRYYNIEMAIIGYCIASLLSTFVSLLVIFKMVEISPARLYRELCLVVVFAVAIIWLNL